MHFASGLFCNNVNLYSLRLSTTQLFYLGVNVDYKATIESSTNISTELAGRRITGSVGLTGVFDDAQLFQNLCWRQ